MNEALVGNLIDFLEIEVLRFSFPVPVIGPELPVSRSLCHRKHKKFPERASRSMKNFDLDLWASLAMSETLKLSGAGSRKSR